MQAHTKLEENCLSQMRALDNKKAQLETAAKLAEEANEFFKKIEEKRKDYQTFIESSKDLIERVVSRRAREGLQRITTQPEARQEKLEKKRAQVKVLRRKVRRANSRIKSFAQTVSALSSADDYREIMQRQMAGA
ncbi:uncharacterized protein LOC128212447 isoform X2 [Mya arenaria]|uniref:uncharacterized protein LOC128212447 isoform X2 n=1 Tax=Mya arenaria TaxID=6604 RepID=UPI0022DEB75C|nr:uncharacterized protein LOC128212447 isoform X2 [Mya arenaria]